MRRERFRRGKWAPEVAHSDDRTSRVLLWRSHTLASFLRSWLFFLVSSLLVPGRLAGGDDSHARRARTKILPRVDYDVASFIGSASNCDPTDFLLCAAV